MKTIEELKLNLQQKEKELEELKSKEEEKDKSISEIKNEKVQLQKKNLTLQTKISSLQVQVEQLNKNKTENDSKIDSEINSLKTSLEDMKTQNKIMNQAAKQIFMQYLTNDIYIESIENCFNTQDVNKYFENIYNLSAQIKPNIIIDYWKNLLSSNKELVKTIEQYNLDTSLENKINEFSNFKKVEDINKDENQQFIIKLLKEMTEYISNLRKTIMNQSNTFEDLNKQKKFRK